jgi:hypothetical protein
MGIWRWKMISSNSVRTAGISIISKYCGQIRET